MRDYINNVYQSYSRFTPVNQNIETFTNNINETGKKNVLFEHWTEKDKETGILYNEKPNWLGGKTEDISQAMADRIFENVNVPINPK